MFKTRTRTVLLLAGLGAMIAAPFAIAAGEGEPLRGGVRNPGADQRQHYTQETQVIANIATYGTRQSNMSANGGGAIYGCRSGPGGTPQNMRPCLRATNLRDGLAFEFESRGGLAGTINVGNGGDNVRPFTTNATGVATGLNADRVDGHNGADLAKSNELLFAAVNSAGNVTASRGGETSASYNAANNQFTVVMGRDVSACSFTANQTGTEGDIATLQVASTGGRNVSVRHSGNDPVPFHLQVVC
jgi:hypothetical protein